MKCVLLMVILLLSDLLAGPVPMESIKNYNIILVHGASDRWGGIDCVEDSLQEAVKGARDSAGFFKMVGGIKKNDGKISSAAGMLRALVPWLSDTILEDKNVVYLQRPLTQPAGSPLQNASEIGDRKWKGKGGCAARRSLIEEAQEVKAGGRENLKDLRTSKNYFNIPSRNILIGYSMGGVASSEYVRGASI
mgnify:CR=1 FL=1